ncbi:OPT oligopeptide transporter protein-domain-containing protein [Mycena olivaceomarginata]|nr:OPT oligopeptide transporter protein-domain-containing protein [Mycena olivaceomarginata]
MIQAITNQLFGLNVITELIIGYALPERPVTMMMFKTWGYITMLGHYMKIRPHHMFTSQVVATIIAGTVQLSVQAWMFTNIGGMCDRDQKDGFWCPSTGMFGTAFIIWGIYYTLTFFFLIGFLCPLKWPNSWFRYLNFPVIFSGTGLIPPANSNNYVPWAIVGFIFQHVIRCRHFAWWTQYDYVLSAALDSGVAVSAVVIFFILQYPMNGNIGINTIQVWWENTVWLNTADGRKTPLIALADEDTFGPSMW